MRRLAFVAVVSLSSSGCSLQKSIYWPNVVNAPTLGERKDAHVAVHGSPIDWQGNGAYAVTEHLALRGQVQAHPGVLVTGDVGIGVFGGKRTSDGRAAHSGLRWGLSADVGSGEGNAFTAGTALNFDEDDNLESQTWRKTLYRTSFRRAAAQAEIGLLREKFEVVGVLRTTAIRGTVHQTAIRKTTGEPTTKEESSLDIYWDSLDPVLITRSHFSDRWHLEMQFGAALFRGNRIDDFSERGLLWPLIVSVGISSDF